MRGFGMPSTPDPSPVGGKRVGRGSGGRAAGREARERDAGPPKG